MPPAETAREAAYTPLDFAAGGRTRNGERASGIRFLPVRLNDLIETAALNRPLSADVEFVAKEIGLPVPEVIDLFARTVATGYLRGDYPFGFADMAMNQLFAFAHVATGFQLSEFAAQVFGAFDQGEYIREGASIEEQGEALTRRLLSGIPSLGGA